MARAFVYPKGEPPQSGAGGVGFLVTYGVVYTGTDVPGGRDISDLPVQLAGTESAVQLRSLITDAAVAGTGGRFVVARGDVILPATDKGV